jgi:hypothetical protein
VRARTLFSAAAALVALALAPAWAVASPEQRLADRYAPIAVLADQKKPCTGEAWRPTTVGIVLDNPEVALHGPGKGKTVIARAPTAADLFGRGEGYFLDFPGNPLRPRCRYDRDGKRFAPTPTSSRSTEPPAIRGLVVVSRCSTGSSTTSTTSTTNMKPIGKASSSCSMQARRVRRCSRSRLRPATRSTRAESRRIGTAKSSRRSATTRSSIPPPARTQATTRPRSGLVRVPARASAVTTPTGRQLRNGSMLS